MKNIDRFDPNFWDDGSFNTNRAMTELKKHIALLRKAYQFTYEGECDFDSKLHQNFLRRLGAAHAAALANLPNSEDEIDDWIKTSLSAVVLHLGYANAAACRGSDYKNAANPYIRTAEKLDHPVLHSNSANGDQIGNDGSRGIETIKIHDKPARFQHTDCDKIEQVTIDGFIDYNASPRTITLFKSLRKSFPFESDQQIQARRTSVQQRCREILYESDPDPTDYDYWKTGSKHHLKRKKPKVKYVRYSQVTTVTSTVPRDEHSSTLDVHQVFMNEVRKWVYNRPLEPGETHEMILSDAMEKYSKLLKTNPKETCTGRGGWKAYYMKAIVNNRKDIWKHRNTQKRSHEQPKNQIHLNDDEKNTEPSTYDYYPSDTIDWFNSLSDRQRDGIRQAVEIIDSSTEKQPKIPESVKRMIRGPGVSLKGSTREAKKTNITIKSDADTKSGTEDLREYESEEELLSKYPEYLHPVAVRTGKPASPTIKYYAKNNKQHA
ncbi:hypothetical protein ACSVIA_14160 [Rhodococcus erythropolis]|uniref:hypothetical protein n=1 Tax=Rhodococcus erythropolis TaxID=1833 RepID=UPI00404103DC